MRGVRHHARRYGPMHGFLSSCSNLCKTLTPKLLAQSASPVVAELHLRRPVIAFNALQCSTACYVCNPTDFKWICLRTLPLLSDRSSPATVMQRAHLGAGAAA